MGKKSIYHLIMIIGLSTISASLGYAQQKNINAKDSNAPIEITSDRMRSENGGQKIIFSGNVLISKEDMTIASDIIEVYNSTDKKQTEEIVAIGNVTISRGTKKAKGDRAVYLERLQKIILTGNPKATVWEGNDIIEGREMIFLMKKDRFVINKRVRANLFPKNKK
jgi:lipopolysaccharide export system protein LptA